MEWKQSETADVIDTPEIHEGEGVITRRRFFHGEVKLPVKFEIWELPPGASEGSHIHDGADALEEFYYFIGGEGVMWMDGREQAVQKGDAVLAPQGTDHGFRNTGDETLKLLLIWGPPKIKE